MSNRINISQIWWRNVRLGEFYNIERHHQIKGGGGALYIEIPSSMVRGILNFFGITAHDLPFTIQVRNIRAPHVVSPLEFHSKAGGRMRIARQNRQQPNSLRHPAWTAAFGFPSAPDGVGSSVEAMEYFPNGGLRIFIAKTVEGDYYAGFTVGPRPAGMDTNNPMWNLFEQGRVVGGVIDAD